MDWQDSFNRLQFDDDFIANYQIYFVSAVQFEAFV